MTAGLLCLFGMINLVPGVYDLVLATTDGQDWSGGEDVYPPVVLLLSALIQVREHAELAELAELAKLVKKLAELTVFTTNLSSALGPNHWQRYANYSG